MEIGNFKNRVMIPLLVPLVALGLIVFVVLNVSRIFLAIEGTPAVVVAMASAMAILFVAAWLSNRGGARVGGNLMGLAFAGIVVLGAGFAAFAWLEEEHTGPPQTAAGGTVQKPGPPDVTIHAFDIGFREKRVTAPAGQVKIAEVNDGQIRHTLVIEHVPDLKLAVGGHGEEDEATVNLKPGTYTYYCDVPGHRQAGMEGVLVVAPEPAPAAGAGTGQQGPPSLGSSLEVKAGDLLLAPKQASVPAGAIRITYRNAGNLEHTLVVDGQPRFNRLMVAPGEEQTQTLHVPPGTYTLYCDVPGHRAAGMEMTLTVG
jgi:uncharacterized cupredoxin-like copper-binding protein